MITPIYAALLAIVFVVLSIRTIVLRRKYQVAIGDDANKELARAMRVHGNFAEYVPYTLLLLYFAENTGANTNQIHGLGAALLAGRIIHAYGVSKVNEDLRFRIIGMLLTFLTLGTSAAIIISSHIDF